MGNDRVWVAERRRAEGRRWRESKGRGRGEVKDTGKQRDRERGAEGDRERECSYNTRERERERMQPQHPFKNKTKKLLSEKTHTTQRLCKADHSSTRVFQAKTTNPEPH